MRLDGVEVKVTLEKDQLKQAMDVLELDDESSLTIWFYDDLTIGQQLPLLGAGVIVRVRAKSDGGGDCTVKLRPCRRSQLTSRWLATEATDRLELRVEEDWAGQRKVLAASAESDVERAVLDKVRSHDALPSGLVNGAQEEYVADCAEIRVNLEATTRLGPIDATRWKSVGPAELAALDVRAERWTVAGLDFLELSIKASLAEAEQAARALNTALTRLGLTVNKDQETKTRRVLEHLAAGGHP
jgi:ribosomal protein S7